MTFQEYYYIPREGKKNPSGKFYYKFGKRHSIPPPCIDDNALNTTSSEVNELDDSVINALKTSLSRESANWNEVCDKWSKTFQARQNDLRNLTNIEFLKAWPKLSDSRAPELVFKTYVDMYRRCANKNNYVIFVLHMLLILSTANISAFAYFFETPDKLLIHTYICNRFCWRGDGIYVCIYFFSIFCFIIIFLIFNV